MRDITEEMLEKAVNAAVDRLKDAKPGTREALTATAALKAARKELADYQKKRRWRP